MIICYSVKLDLPVHAICFEDKNTFLCSRNLEPPQYICAFVAFFIIVICYSQLSIFLFIVIVMISFSGQTYYFSLRRFMQLGLPHFMLFQNNSLLSIHLYHHPSPYNVQVPSYTSEYVCFRLILFCKLRYSKINKQTILKT